MIEVTSPQLILPPTELPDLAPMIVRQRMVIEGLMDTPIDAAQIGDYLTKLSDVLEMKLLAGPFTNRSEQFGWAGWIHWETSGAHFYAWEEPTLFFSVDIYTCKAFDQRSALDFTANTFDARQCVGRSF
jgi:S-adenosylmethionine decarboxylase